MSYGQSLSNLRYVKADQADINNADINSVNVASNKVIFDSSHATINQNLTINGDLIVNGENQYISTTNLLVNDNLVKFADGNTSSNIDIGFYAPYSNTQFMSFFRDHTDAKFKVAQNISNASEPTLTMPTYDYADFQSNNCYAANFYKTGTTTSLNDLINGVSSLLSAHTSNTSNPHNVTRAQLSLDTTNSPTFAGLTLTSLTGVIKAAAGVLSGSATTSDLPEGTNLYYTDTRARAALSSGTNISYNSTTGAISLATEPILASMKTTSTFTFKNNTSAAILTLDQSGNLNILGTLDGRNVATDGSNLDAHIANTSNPHNVTRAQLSLDVSNSPTFAGLTLTGKSGVLKAATGIISGSATTSDLTEGTNLYYTDARARASLSAGSNISYNSTTGVISCVSSPSLSGLTVGTLSGVIKASTGVLSGSATTTDLTEGTNLYYTQARFDSAFTAKSTSNLAEGANLYYTDTRARAALSASANISYNSTTGAISVVSTPSFSTLNLSNGSTGSILKLIGATAVGTDDPAQGAQIWFVNNNAAAGVQNKYIRVDNGGLFQFLNSSYVTKWSMADDGSLQLLKYTGASYLKTDASGNVSCDATTFTSDVRSQFSSGTNISVSSGVISTSASPTFTNLQVGTVNGNSTFAGVRYTGLDDNSFALLQYTGGDTYLNCKTGTAVNFRVANSSVGTYTSSLWSISIPIAFTNYTGASYLKTDSSGDVSCNASTFTSDVQSQLYNGSNTYVGSVAGSSLSTGTENTYIGYQSGTTNSTGSYQTFVGSQAGKSCTATYTAAFGRWALFACTSGQYNTAIGTHALRNTNGNRNTAIGTSPGFDMTSGDSNTLLGMEAGQHFTSGSSNIFIGDNAGNNNPGTYSNSIVIGNNTACPASNTTVIAPSYVSNANSTNMLFYNTTSGLVSYDSLATNVRAQISAGTGVSISSGAISIGQAVGSGNSPTFVAVNENTTANCVTIYPSSNTYSQAGTFPVCIGAYNEVVFVPWYSAASLLTSNGTISIHQNGSSLFGSWFNAGWSTGTSDYFDLNCGTLGPGCYQVQYKIAIGGNCNRTNITVKTADTGVYNTMRNTIDLYNATYSGPVSFIDGFAVATSGQVNIRWSQNAFSDPSSSGHLMEMFDCIRVIKMT